MSKKKKNKLGLEFGPEKKPSFMSKFENLFQKKKQKVPLTFNVGIAIILFFCYLSITFVSLPTQPQLLIILIPTLYIIARHIKLERETRDDKPR